MNLFALNLNTIPDVVGGRRLYSLEGLGDKEVAEVMLHRQRQQRLSVLPLHQRRVASVSGVLRTKNGVELYRSSMQGSEVDVVSELFNTLETQEPALISWNGSRVDLPILHYRALFHSVSAPKYWNGGDQDDDMYWSNIDLKEVLAGYHGSATAPLHEVASLLGLPAGVALSDEQVWDLYLANDFDAIAIATDVSAICIYAIYLRFSLIRGHFSQTNYEQEVTLFKQYLESHELMHLQSFVAQWNS